MTPGTHSAQTGTQSYRGRAVPSGAHGADSEQSVHPLSSMRKRTHRCGCEASPARRGLMKIVRAVGATSALIPTQDTPKPTAHHRPFTGCGAGRPAETTRTTHRSPHRTQCSRGLLCVSAAPMRPTRHMPPRAERCCRGDPSTPRGAPSAPVRAPRRYLSRPVPRRTPVAEPRAAPPAGPRDSSDSRPNGATSGHAQRHQTAHAIARSRARDTHGPISFKIDPRDERGVPTRPRGGPPPRKQSQKHPNKLTHSYSYVSHTSRHAGQYQHEDMNFLAA